MENELLIKMLAEQLQTVAETISVTAEALSELKANGSDVAEAYEHMLADDITHAQILVLEITKAAVGDEKPEQEAPEEDKMVHAVKEEPETVA